MTIVYAPSRHLYRNDSEKNLFCGFDVQILETLTESLQHSKATILYLPPPPAGE